MEIGRVKMFTRQHYIAIAAIIKNNKTRIKIDNVKQLSHGLPCLRLAIIGDLADYFASDNSLFDQQKFLEACEKD